MLTGPLPKFHETRDILLPSASTRQDGPWCGGLRAQGAERRGGDRQEPVQLSDDMAEL